MIWIVQENRYKFWANTGIFFQKGSEHLWTLLCSGVPEVTPSKQWGMFTPFNSKQKQLVMHAETWDHFQTWCRYQVYRLPNLMNRTLRVRQDEAVIEMNWKQWLLKEKMGLKTQPTTLTFPVLAVSSFPLPRLSFTCPSSTHQVSQSPRHLSFFCH